MVHPLFKKYGLEHLSISQVKTIKRSPFAWVCEKVLGRRSPDTEATAFGSFVHDNFQRWLTEKVEDPTEPHISEKAEAFHVPAWDEKTLKFWKEYRARQGCWPEVENVERKFSISLGDDLPPFIGMVDVVDLCYLGENELLVVQDHKTIGNKKFAYKTPEELAEDPQLNLYAHAMRRTESGAVLQHNQLFKKIKRKPVNILSVEVTWEHVERVVKQVRDDALEAIKILENYSSWGIERFAYEVREQYEGTRWDFGGCPHWDFHQENKKKYLDKKNKVVYSGVNKGGDTMPEDLHALVGKARTYFEEHGLKKFDLADAIVASVVNNLKDKSIRAVHIRDGEGGDLIYNQLLNQVAEMNIEIYKKVR